MRTGYDSEKTMAPPPHELLQKQEAEREWHRRHNDAPMASEPMPPGGQIGGVFKPSDQFIVEELFRYHPPTLEQLPRYESINQAAKNFAAVILANCPGGADRAAAIRMLRECRMTANAAIALNGLSF